MTDIDPRTVDVPPDPERLIDADPYFARLVEASETDRPSATEIDKALAMATKAASLPRPAPWYASVRIAALGVAVAGAVTLAVGAWGDAPEHAPDPRAAATTPADRPSTNESTGVGADVTTNVGSDVATTSDTNVGSTEAPPIVSPVVTLSVHDLAPPEPSRDDNAGRSPEPAGARGRTGSSVERPRDATSARPSARGASATFAEELALVTSARSALEGGDPAGCLAALKRYDDRFGNGTFADEADVLRMEAHAAAGNREIAMAAARRFLSTRPKSPYAARVRSLAERIGH